MAIGKRSGVDWSEHLVDVYTTEDIAIHALVIPGRGAFKSVKFINSHGIMAVTGDYGHWIFSREFNPDDPNVDKEVCDRYWCEKASYNSTQELYEFDPNATHEIIKEWKQEILDEAEGAELSERDKKRIEFWDACDELVDQDNALYYKVRACDLKPGFMDYDQVPYQKSIKPWLLIVFDAWEEICRQGKTLL
jgi:hypothetical protein